MFHDVVSGSDVRAASASAVAVRRMVCYVQYFNFFQWMSSNASVLCGGWPGVCLWGVSFYLKTPPY